MQTRGGGVQTRGDGVRARDGRVQTKGSGVWTKGGGVRTRDGGVQTRGGHIYDDPHFRIDFPSSSVQYSSFTFSSPLDQSLPYSLVPSIDEGVIQEDVGTSFI